MDLGPGGAASVAHGAHIVVMGVSGCGKTSIGKALAERLGRPFAEGDDFHSEANVAKMAAGRPLDDADRGPWLRALRAWFDCLDRDSLWGVMSCSALKRAYRDVLRGTGGRPVEFVHLDGARDTIAARMAARAGHYMPTALLDSQLADLEALEPEEGGIVVSLESPPDVIIRTILDSV